MTVWRIIAIGLGLGAMALAGFYTLAVAQDQEELEERNALVEFVERIISTPDRQIRLGTISGVLSSNVSFSEITIADRGGVWLRIDNVHLVWSRTALILGRLEISQLEADAIVMERRPLPPEDEIPEEARLTVPELPVATNIERLAVPRVSFGEDVFGLSSELSVAGRLRLAEGDLDTALEIERLDGPGGRLDLAAAFDSAAESLELDIRLSEPADGVVANLLDLRGRPALTFAASGAGALADFSAEISLVADDQELLAGTTEVVRVANGFRFVAEVGGRLGELVPSAYADLFGEVSTLAIDAIRADDGSVSIARAEVVSGVMSLDASAELAPDWFPVAFALDARLGTDSDDLVTLPFGDGIVVRSAHILAEVGGDNGETWSAEFDLQGFVTGTLSAQQVTIAAGGLARDRADPEAREVTFEMSGAATGLGSADPAIAEALGSSVELAASGGWSYGQPIAINEARLAAEHVEARFAGAIVDDLIDGDYTLASDDLAAFAGLVGQDLGGAVALQAAGTVGLRLDEFDLTIDGTADDLAVGVEPVDALFAGRTTLAGGVARDEDGLRFDDLVLDHANVRATIAGDYGRDEVDVAVAAALPDLSVVTERAGGAVRLDATLTGVAEAPAIEATLSGEALMLIGRPFADARARFVGTLAGRDVAGDFSLTGLLDSVAIDLSANVSTVDGLYELEDIALRAGATQATGDLTVRSDGLLAGALRLESPDLSVIAPLTLTELTGTISAAIDLSIVDEGQAAHVVATARDVRAGEGFAVGSADIDVRGENLRRAPILAGEVEGSAIVVGPIEIAALAATAERVGDRTEFAATAELTDGVVTATGRLVPDNGGLDIEFDTFELRDAALDATLAEPVVIAIRNGTVAIPSARLAVGGGGVVVAGEIGETVDLRAQVSALNLAVANAFAPGLGLTGTVSGNLAAAGPAAAPRGSFQLQGSGLSTAQLREVGVGAFAFEAQGEIAAGVVDLQAAVSGGGISLAVSGAVPLAGTGLDLAVTGSAPLSLTDIFLAQRGASLAGTLVVDARVTGSLAAPSFSGTLAAEGATFADADTGIQLTAITLRASFGADQLVIDTLTARAAGGTLSATGAVGLGGGFPADLSVALADFRYQDGRLLTAIIDGQLAVTGPLVGAPVLGGVINVERAEIAVPERIPDAAAMLDVVHRAPPPAVLDTLRRARLDEPRLREQRTGLVLDLTINAPARIFVRGRGIDAEFGGSMTLTGPVSDIQPIGSFEMRRGHITILGQRINFSFGTITLLGDLDPVLEFVATSRVRSVEITANVTGRASDPDIALTSVPELPQDEVFAQFLFGRSLRDLSPLQIAQLASAAAGLAGGTDATGLLGQLRGATGLDELDLVVGEEGGVAVQAGRYVVENVYLGVRAGQEGEAGVTVNLDISDDITARGELGTDGRSKIGVFFEREY